MALWCPAQVPQFKLVKRAKSVGPSSSSYPEKLPRTPSHAGSSEQRTNGTELGKLTGREALTGSWFKPTHGSGDPINLGRVKSNGGAACPPGPLYPLAAQSRWRRAEGGAWRRSSEPGDQLGSLLLLTAANVHHEFCRLGLAVVGGAYLHRSLLPRSGLDGADGTCIESRATSQ